MKTESTRHHYIPKFVSNGFINSSGLLYIYDKEKDEIKSKPRSPKSIFFEDNRNTVKINESESSSAIEDIFFKKLDDDSSKVLKNFQTKDITHELLSDENQGIFQFFIINLFWRLPYTDYAFKDLINRAIITSENIDPDTLRNDETFQKLKRTGLYQSTIDQMGSNIRPKATQFVKMSEFGADLFILGDNPIIFTSTPMKFTDLIYKDYMFAVSSTRIYSSSLEEMNKFNRQMGYDLNALIIDQSIKYTVSGDIKLLKDSVNYFKKLKEENILFRIKELLFNKI